MDNKCIVTKIERGIILELSKSILSDYLKILNKFNIVLGENEDENKVNILITKKQPLDWIEY